MSMPSIGQGSSRGLKGGTAPWLRRSLTLLVKIGQILWPLSLLRLSPYVVVLLFLCHTLLSSVV